MLFWRIRARIASCVTVQGLRPEELIDSSQLIAGEGDEVIPVSAAERRAYTETSLSFLDRAVGVARGCVSTGHGPGFQSLS